MNSKTDQQLLREYAESRSEVAFTELVRRYVDFVHSAALRMLQDSHLAQDVAQGVFLALAQNAAQLTERTVLAGWLHRTTQNLAAKTIRSDVRRRTREQEVMAMNELLSSELPWDSLAPHLDAALDELSETDRDAVLLRYFQQKSAREMATMLGLSNDAAQKRVTRAVERLRELLARRGLKIGASGLTGLMAAHGVQPSLSTLGPAIATAVSRAVSMPVGLSSTSSTFVFTTLQKSFLTMALFSVIGMAVYQGSRGESSLADSTQDSVHNPEGAQTTQKSEIITRQRSSFTPSVSRELTKLMDELRTALHTPWPSKYGTRSYPPEDVLRALANFGTARKEAFGTLLEATNDSDGEVRRRAVSAMWWVGKAPTPQLGRLAILGEPTLEAKPFLWRVLQEDNKELSNLALNSLRNIGFEANEIPLLASLLSRTTDGQLFRYVPEAIAATMQKEPVAAAPYVSSVNSLLSHSNTPVQFAAACALAKHSAATNPRILEILIWGLKTKEGLHELMALETLEKLGSVAEPALQPMLDFANASSDGVIKKVAFTAIGKIREDLREHLPEVEQALVEQENFNRWGRKFAAEDLSYQELLEALKLPNFAARAATHLGRLGPSAREVIPNLMAALSGQDQMKRDEILKAIHQIDPIVVIEKVNSSVVARAATDAYLNATGGTVNDQRTKASKLLDDLRAMNSEWYTKEEVLEVVKKLAPVPSVHQSSWPNFWKKNRA